MWSDSTTCGDYSGEFREFRVRYWSMRIEDSYRRIFYGTEYFVPSNITETGIFL